MNTAMPPILSLPALTRLFLFAFLLIYFGALLAVGPFLASFLLLLPLLLLLINHPRRLLLFYWGWTLFSPTTEFFFTTPIIKMAEQGLATGLIILLIGHIMFHPRKIPNTRPIFWGILGMISFITLSTIANQVPLIPVIHFTLSYCKPFALFFFTLWFMSPQTPRHVLWIFVGSCILQMLLNAAAYAGWNPLPLFFGRTFVDFSTGTLYGCNHVAYYMAALLFLLVISLQYVTHRKFFLILILACASTVQFFFTFTFHAVAIFALVFSILVLTLLLKAQARIMGIILLTALLGSGFVFYTFHNTMTEFTNNPQNLLTREEWERPVSMVEHGFKGLAYKRVFLWSWDFLPYPMLGGGPANFASPLGYHYKRPLALAYMSDHHQALEFGQRLMATSVIGDMNTGLTSLWGDLGPLGFLCFWSLHIVALFRLAHNVRHKKYTNIAQHILAESGFFVLLFYILLNALLDASMYPTLNVGLWIWLATAWNPITTPDNTGLPHSTYTPPENPLQEQKTPVTRYP